MEENNLKSNLFTKRNIIIAAIVVVAIILIVIALCMGGNKKAGSSKGNEKDLNNTLEKIGRVFYEDFYYVQQEKSQENVKEFLAKFEKTGIKINLENLAKCSKVDQSLVEKMVNSKTKEKCDEKETSVTIYPTDPYGTKDYTISLNLSCGLEK